MNTVKSINPATGEVVGETPASTKEDVVRVVAEAKKAFQGWRRTALDQRIALMKKFRTLLETHTEELAELTTKEMGKPISEARADVTGELHFLDWYCDHLHEALDEQIIQETDFAKYRVRYEPYGVCASIAPWNFPVSMVNSGVSQQILVGNTVVFKPSEYTTLSQKRFIELMWEAGFPKGVVQYVIGDGEVGKKLVDSPVDLMWFTGSTVVGQAIYKKCGEKFIKGIMELGGSSPGIVCADVDIEKTVEDVYIARFLNCGQVCTALKRLFVERPLFDAFVEGLRKKVATVKVGDPVDSAVMMGPLVSKEQLDQLAVQVEDAKQKGATVISGGERLTGGLYDKGNFYAPTILTGITKDMRVYTEEIFGPVLPVMPFDTDEEVIDLANDTPYGLSADIYTRDKARAERFAHQIDAGIIGINTDNFFVPFCPTGGFKKSGMGREYGIEGFRELAQIKYICEAK